MFSFFSFDKAKKCFAVGLVLLAAATLLGACDDPKTEPGANVRGALPDDLIGKWVTLYDGFEITKSGNILTLEYDGGGFGDYTGTIEYVSNYNSESGVIIIKYTEKPEFGYKEGKNFHAVYYLNFKPGVSVEFNNTYDIAVYDPNDSTANNVDTGTLNEAIKKFTQSDMIKYMNVSMSMTYTKETP
ncbi:MAG: hypothetical protein LBH43_06075 [Treponema sp.]|jgi:hypothetical protein|nr:hypothetical protein [Treponema sp.]